MNRAEVRGWLIGYAWCEDTQAEREAVVDCILAQGGWQYVDARQEQLLGQRSGEESAEHDSALALHMALSGLYECHDEPHLDACPMKRKGSDG